MDYILYFFIFSFLGWVLETVYASVLHRRYISKQTLIRLPMCPVYGLGAVAMIITLRPVSDSWILLFCGGFFVASSVEYLIALYYEHYFSVSWWDYRNDQGNLNGKVCAKLSLIWGIMAIVFFEIIFPFTEQLVLQTSSYLKLLLCVFLILYFYRDYRDTLREIKKFSGGEPSLAKGKFFCLKTLNYE